MPVILVTQGTIATNPEELLLPTLRALAVHSVAELLPHVSAMVTNGGYGGITMALANGVPVLASGISEDKAEVGNRVQVAGAGINLKSASPPVAKIRDAVRAVLQDPRYRANARRLQHESAEYDAPTLARDLLEELARTRQPVLHGVTRHTSTAN